MARQDLPPGPSYPVLLQGIGQWTRPLAFMERCRARYGKRFTLRFPLNPPFVHVTEPDQIKEVFTAPPDVLQPGAGARVLEPVVGRHSVILLDEAPHMEQRKLMLPAFHGERVERLESLVATVTESEVETWEGELELHPKLQSLTLEIILRAVFGLDPGPRLDDLRSRLAAFLEFGASPLTLLPPPGERATKFFNRFGPTRGFFDQGREIDALIFELIDERRGDHGDREDILALLLEARHEDGSPMSPQELRDELMTLLVAGHETTASTLAWAFECLSRAPEALGLLREEIDGGDDAYVTATIQETLRHRPVLPNAAPRLVAKPIEVGGWEYPTGVCLVPNGYLLHHDPDVYPDPYAFRPERFVESPPGTYSWIPFGGGRRRCLGASFAMLEMKIVLPAVLRASSIEAAHAAHEPPRRRNITVTPGAGARVRLRPRDRAAAAA